MTGRKESLIDELIKQIRSGEQNAVPVSGVAIALGLDERTVRELIHDAILEGVPIASGSGGYYIPATPAEWQKCLEGLKKRDSSTSERYQAMLKQYETYMKGGGGDSKG